MNEHGALWNDFDWGNEKYSENICESGQGLKLDLVGEIPAANGPGHARPFLCNSEVHTAVGFISRFLSTFCLKKKVKTFYKGNCA